MSNEKMVISGLKNQDEKVVSKVYSEYRSGFILFAQRFQLEQTQILDVYQDTLIALCENAKKGYLDNLSSSLKTYIFSIGKYKIFALLKKEQKKLSYEDTEYLTHEWIVDEPIEETESIKALQTAIPLLGEQCVKIIKLFYYDEKNLDEITEIMNYGNKNVVKSQKSRCLKQLKDLIKSQTNN